MILPALFRHFYPPRREFLDRMTRMEFHMSRITDTLLAINDQLNRATKEINDKIEELQSRDYLTDEDKAILENIKVGAQTLDDIVPDEVVEEAEKEAEAEAEAEEPVETAPEATPATDPEDDVAADENTSDDA